MLGISLLFVGIVLVMNGVNRFYKLDAKSNAFMNASAGILIVICNFIMLSQAKVTQDYQNVASGFLFGFTYVFIACNHLFKIDLRQFGWYSLFVAIYAIIMSVITFSSGMWVFGILWAAWAVLWLEGFLELVAKLKIGKIFPYLSIFEGVFAAFIPAILILTDVIQNGVIVF